MHAAASPFEVCMHMPAASTHMSSNKARISMATVFSDPRKWQDNRRSKPTPRHPDFKHKETKVALWLDNRRKPACVDSQLATWEAGMMTRTPEPVFTSVQGQGGFAAHEAHLEVGICKKLCDDGRIRDAVDALILLVQRGHLVSSKAGLDKCPARFGNRECFLVPRSCLNHTCRLQLQSALCTGAKACRRAPLQYKAAHLQQALFTSRLWEFMHSGDHDRHVCHERMCPSNCKMAGCKRKCGSDDHFNRMTSADDLCGNEHTCHLCSMRGERNV